MGVEIKENYIVRDYTPHDENDLICEYFVEPKKISLEKAAQKIASESGIGSWADVKTLTQKQFDALSPKVFYQRLGRPLLSQKDPKPQPEDQNSE